MSLLRPFSILLRNTLIKQHPYFSCCASCGEIKTPLGNRLCTSLSFPYSIDIVLTGLSAGEAYPSVKKVISHIQECCVWVSKLFIVSRQPLKPSTPQPEDLSIIYLQEADIVSNTLNGNVEEYIHTIPNLSEYYLVVPHTMQLTNKTHPLDFFTPNGIPLLYGVQYHNQSLDFSPISPIQPYTKESVTAFMKLRQSTTTLFNSPNFYSNYAQWTYENGLAILASA